MASFHPKIDVSFFFFFAVTQSAFLIASPLSVITDKTLRKLRTDEKRVRTKCTRCDCGVRGEMTGLSIKSRPHSGNLLTQGSFSLTTEFF